MFKKQKHKLFGKTKTVDDAFEEQRENFKKLTKIYHGIEKDLNKYDGTIKGINNSLQFLGTSFGKLYAENPESDVAKFSQCTELIGEASKAYTEQQETLKSELQAYVQQLNEFKHRIAERDNALVMGDAAAEALESLKKKDGNEAKIPKAEEEATKTRDQYVTLNDQLGQDLSVFFENRCVDFDDKFKMLVASQVELFKSITEAFQMISNADGDTDDFIAAAPLPSKPKRAVAKVDTNPQWAESDATVQDDAPPISRTTKHVAAVATTTTAAAATTKTAAAQEPNLPAKKNAVGKAVAASAFKGGDPFEDEAVQAAAGNYIADAAMNEEMQDKAGKAVASKAKDKDAQAKMGNAIAANSDNKLVQAAAKNSAIQSAAGSVVGAAAGSKKVRQATGKAVANAAKDKDKQKKAAGFLKKGFGK